MLIGTYSSPPSSANSYSTLGELMVKLPDNTANQIVPKDIRDSVFTLWDRIDVISASVSSSTVSVVYNRTTPSTAPVVGGVATGSTFSGTIQDALDRIFYPYVAPAPSISIPSLNPREYGYTTAFSLSWSVTKNSNSITSITVNGTPVVPTGNSQAGTLASTGTYSTLTGVIDVVTSQSTSYAINVSDGVSSPSANVSLTWMNKIYWGSIDLSSISNPNLTTSPGSAPLVATLTTDAAIKALSGSELSTTKTKSYNGINGGGKYLIFAWPTCLPTALTPVFTVNGLPSTAFTRVRTNSSFVNQYGITVKYEVWVSNTLQNSPITLFQIT